VAAGGERRPFPSGNGLWPGCDLPQEEAVESKAFGDFSLVILTYNRSRSVQELLAHVSGLAPYVCDIVVVDNASTDDTQQVLRDGFPGIRYCRTSENLGACGRNYGIEAAGGEFVITLDDDIFGISLGDLSKIRAAFRADSAIAAVNFRVVDYFTGRLTNWVHHRDTARSRDVFETYEITEGAVAFRKAALVEVGMYWPLYFISHEGPDLAFRLMDAGYRVVYDGSLAVRHKHEVYGRPSWRFYYYDTRNLIWLAVRKMSPAYGAGYLVVNVFAMAYYSLLGGHLIWWLKGVRDGLSGLPEVRRTRQCWTPATERRVRIIDKDRVPFLRRLRDKLGGSGSRLDG
jgi:GT2 family glycosyltransferase